MRTITLTLVSALLCLLGAAAPACAQSPLHSNPGTDTLYKQSTPAVPAAGNPQPGAVASSGQYSLGAGDHIRLTVYDEDDLSGAYVVGANGYVALPLIGNVQAAGLTVRQLEGTIREKLSHGYLLDPKVSVQIVDYRPFFILGEVSKPGSYPYENGMTVLNAVALAGGYTYRASTSRIKIIHAGDPDKREQGVQENAPVKPGDIIKVPERYF